MIMWFLRIIITICRDILSDTNPAGDIFSGRLMGQMDIVSGIVARQRAGGHAVTVAVDGFVFHKPVHVGAVVDYIRSF